MDTPEGNSKKLVWKDEYSVNIEEIDNQHKHFIDVLNNLISVINSSPEKGEVEKILQELLAYKAIHFATEEKYFHEFGYDGAEEHERAHWEFSQKILDMQIAHEGDPVALAFELVDFMEDWFVGHLTRMDQGYVGCFHEHGLR